jgi:site-specific DNA recombinase
VSELQTAIYARVSSERQASEHTIASQVAALEDRVAADGFGLLPELRFIDDGYSGSTLRRPALEHLRDAAAAGQVDRLYVHAPDRLARTYVHQVLLVDELRSCAVELVFLNHPVSRSAEDELLLQVQGIIAEYERAKTLERSRRGKRHAAQQGDVSVLAGAPYGYRYIGKGEGGGQARYEIVLEDARVVRQIFAWVGTERVSIREVRRRLHQAAIPTQTGKPWWDACTLLQLLRNPAYIGRAAYGKTRNGPRPPSLRPGHGRSAHPRQLSASVSVPADEWVRIPVPALVGEELFATVQDQLDENRQRARHGQRGARWLLQGLICCAQCGYSYCGRASRCNGKTMDYGYYRCTGNDLHREEGIKVCTNKPVRTDRVEAAVWREVRGLLEEPERLQQEYDRRLRDGAERGSGDGVAAHESQLRKLRRGMGRLIDSYTDGIIEQEDFTPRITRFKERIATLERDLAEATAAAGQQQELRLVIGRLDDFAATVHDTLDQVDWTTRQTIIRTLVKRVEIDLEEIRVIFRVGPEPPDHGGRVAVSQDCSRRLQAKNRQCPLTEGRATWDTFMA